MKFFKDTADSDRVYAYEDHVTVVFKNGMSSVWVIDLDDDGNEKSRTQINAPSSLVETTEPEPPPHPVQHRAAVAIEAGLTIVSQSNEALNGRYAVDAAAQAKIMAADHYASKRGAFYGGATTYPWLDADGVPHTFNLAEFDAFAMAVGDYIAMVDAVATGQAEDLPLATVTIP